jgi:hypothetical protein
MFNIAKCISVVLLANSLTLCAKCGMGGTFVLHVMGIVLFYVASGKNTCVVCVGSHDRRDGRDIPT